MIGVVKLILISTASPVFAPSPRVVWLGFLLMPLTTLFATVKLALASVGVKSSVRRLESRVAESISTSAGRVDPRGHIPRRGIDRIQGGNVVKIDLRLGGYWPWPSQPDQ